MTELMVRGPQLPQGNVHAQPVMLPHFAVPAAAGTLWLVGAHGGAGVSTLTRLDPLFADARRRWPQGIGPMCVVVARTSASGLLAARGVLAHWADGGARSARLIGLILIDDAPGRLPKPLADLASVVSGGAPRTWRIAWNHAWRCGEPVGPDTASPDVRRLLSDLKQLIDQPRTTI